MSTKKNKEIIKQIELSSDFRTNPDRLKDYIEMGQNVYLVDDDYEEGKRVCTYGKEIALVKARKNYAYYEVYMLALKYLARYFHDFDSYLIYVEHKRDSKQQFYLPRRAVLRKLNIVQSLQDLLDDKLDILSISMATGTGKTSIEEFFVSYYMGLYPEKYNLFSSHTAAITDMFYRAVYSIITSAEYAWKEVFPDVRVESKSDKDQNINLGSFKPFKTLSCKSIGSATAGVTRANGILCCDDLIEGKEEAFSPERLEKKYESYSIDLRTRKMEGCKELHICTRWSVHDIIGHLISMYDDDPRARFIAVDCYDENGESIFTYRQNGFTTQYFKDLEQSMDNVSFQCMFRSKPIEREGRLYTEEELNYYLGGLPVDDKGNVKEADAILGVCDTKDTGTDYNCLLIGVKYGQKVYLEDVIYDNGSPYVLDELNADCIVRNNTQMCQFESNKEGSRTGNEVQKLVDQKGGRCTITKKYTTQNKETKIMVNSDWVKKHVVFKDKSEWNKMYKAFMENVFSYVQLGKNKHDDGVDALAMLALFVQSFEYSQIEIMSRSKLGI